MEKINLKISCRNLYPRDENSLVLSFPMVMLHKKVYNPLTKSYDWDKKPQKTEVLQNTLNPVFEKMFSIDYVFSEKLELKFLVVDVHGYEYLEDSEDHDFLGSVEITLDEIVYEKKPVTLPLKYGSFQNLGVIKIAPFAKKLHDKIDLTLAFHAILEKPIFNKINTFFTIHRSNLLDKNFELLHESDVISKCFKPVSPNLELNLANVLKEADSEEDCLLKFEVFQQKLVGNAEFMGCFQTTLNELITNKGRALEFELINERKRVAKSGNKSGVVSSYKNSGIFNVSCIKYDQYTSFFDYVYNGLKLNAGFAIDLRINEVHHDSVLKFLTSFGSFLESHKLTNKKKFDFLGFNSINYEKIPYCLKYQNNIIEASGECARNLLETYLLQKSIYSDTEEKDSARKNIDLEKIINNIMEKINGSDSISPYFLYTIITDLDAIEIPKAVKSFLLASGLPVSIYVIGFSETKFPNLEAIFSEISANSSSLLSVRFKFLKSDEYEGASEVQDALIKNIPEQIMHFMKSICISPDIIRINNNEKEKSKELTKKCSETFVPDIPKEEFSSRRPSKISPCPSRNSTSMVLTNFSDSSKGGFANPNLPLNEAADFRLSSVFNRRESELYQDAHFSEGRRRSVSVSSGGLRPRNSSSVRPTTMVFLDEMLSGNSLDPYQPRAVRQQNNNRFSAIFLDELLRSNTVTRDFPLSDTLVEAKAGNQDVLAKELNGGVMVPGEDLFSPSATITSFNSCKESNFENFEKNFNLINNKIENLEAKMETNFKNLERIISILGKNLHSITDKLSRLGSIQNNSMRNMNLQDRKFFASDSELDETFTNEIMLDKNNTEKQSVSLFSGRNEVTN